MRKQLHAAAAGLGFASVYAGAALLLLVQLNYALGLVADRWLGDQPDPDPPPTT